MDGGEGGLGREQGAKAIKMSVLGDRRSEKRKLQKKIQMASKFMIIMSILFKIDFKKLFCAHNLILN